VQESASSLRRDASASFSIPSAIREPPFKPSNVPSAGEYDVAGDLASAEKGVAFPKSVREPTFQEKVWSNNPGAGAYRVEEAHEASQDRHVPSAHVTRSVREAIDSGKDNPGPGAYEHELPASGSAAGVTFGGESQRPMSAVDK
jgi:hypothetical protein